MAAVQCLWVEVPSVVSGFHGGTRLREATRAIVVEIEARESTKTGMVGLKRCRAVSFIVELSKMLSSGSWQSIVEQSSRRSSPIIASSVDVNVDSDARDH